MWGAFPHPVADTLQEKRGCQHLQQNANGGGEEGSSAGHAGMATRAAPCSAGHSTRPLHR